MKTLEISINKEYATLYLNGMLNKSDFDQFWKGIDPDNNDGSAGSYSETVEKIHDIYSAHTLEGESDFQIWGPDPSFAKYVDNSQISALVDEFIQQFPDLEVEYTGELVDELLEKWIVVDFGIEAEDHLRVTRRSNFEEMRFCDAYSNYGQDVGCFNAGCYTLENSGSQAPADCSSAITEKFNVCVSLEKSADDWTVIPTEDDEEFSEELISEIETFIKKWRDDNESHSEVTGWTYHDSHNFRTVILETIFGDPDCAEVDIQQQIEILLQMPESAPYMEGTNISEETADYYFHFDRWSTNPWYCFVEIK